MTEEQQLALALQMSMAGPGSMEEGQEEEGEAVKMDTGNVQVGGITS